MITTAEIARLAGVSRGTVDRVLHKRGKVSPEKQERVQRILKQVNYQPNVFARGLVLSRPFRYGVIMPNTSYGVDYWNAPMAGVQRAEKELASFRVQVECFLYDNYCEECYQDAFQQMLQTVDDLDGLLIAPVFSKNAVRLMNKIPGSLPYVLFDTESPGSHCLTFIGPDSYQGGILSARLMQILIQTGGRIAVIRELPENFHIDERIRAFNTFYQGNSDYTIELFEADRKVNPDILREITGRIVDKFPDLQGIYLASSTAHEVAKVLKYRALDRKIHVLGYDLTPENKDCLKDGSIDFLISTKPEMQGYQGIYSLYKHTVLKEDIDKRICTPLDIVTKENLDFCNY